MAAEEIGNLIPTKIPGYSDDADIQAALRVYHYGSYDYSPSNTSPASLVSPSMAKTIYDIQQDIDALESGYISNTIFTAKGQILSAIASNSPVVLNVGTNNQFLIANSATASGLQWTSSLTAPSISTPTISGGVTLTGSTTGSTVIQASSTAAGTITFPAVTGTVVTTGDTGTVTGTMIANNTIVNADINSAAAIAYSKLSLSNSIVNADVSTSAAIAITKLAASTISGVSLGNNLNSLTISTGLSGTSYNGSSAVTIAIDSTVVTTSGTQTLTNKTFTDNVTTFQDNTDTSKKMQFELSGISASTTRTLTVPNVNGTIVTTGDTGTVTSTMIANDTILNADINSSAAIAITKLAASTISGVSLGNNLNTLTIGTGLSGTSYNGSSAVTIANSGVLSVNGSTGAVTGIATTAGKLSQFAATTSAELAGVISDESGSGSLIFGTEPIITRPIVISPEERWTVSATAATSTINFDIITQSVLYYTSDSTGNFTLNFRGNSGTTLSSLLNVGDCISVIFLNTNGSTAYYATTFQIDGVSVTPIWSGGFAPSQGNSSAVDSYSFSIVKTAATPTYKVLAGGPVKFS